MVGLAASKQLEAINFNSRVFFDYGQDLKDCLTVYCFDLHELETKKRDN
jgi:hypothetical protein